MARCTHHREMCGTCERPVCRRCGRCKKRVPGRRPGTFEDVCPAHACRAIKLGKRLNPARGLLG